MLATHRKWTYMICILIVYTFSCFQVVKDELFNLNETKANDYFDFKDTSAKKWFVDTQLGNVMAKYNEYLERRFNLVEQEKYQYNYTQLMSEYSFTNIHAVTEEKSRTTYQANII